MATLTVNGSGMGNQLQTLMMIPEIKPGEDPSYGACKAVLLYHPLGQKMTEAPVKMAQSKDRIITIPGAPEERLIKAYQEEWKRLGATKHIRNCMKLSRTYGIASVAMGVKGEANSDKPIAPMELHKLPIYFNIYDPLNTAGSLVLNQDPNAPDFQKKMNGIRVGNQVFHPSRTCIVLNEDPVYIAYTNSAYGFVGRSVYQRAWYPLKSYIKTMVTDDMVATKAGLLVAKIKQPGSIASQLMSKAMAFKRNLLKDAETDNVLNIGDEDSVESLDLKNLEDPARFARDNILKNIATSSDMPAALLDQETFARGMAEGTEDAKTIAQYIDGLREDMEALYDYFDRICMLRAWNPEFYALLQSEIPEYKQIGYETAVYSWMNSFQAEWPNFLDEPDSDKVKTEEAKFKSLREICDSIMPHIPQGEKARMIQWVADNINTSKTMFPVPLELDGVEIANYEPPVFMPDQPKERGDDQPE